MIRVGVLRGGTGIGYDKSLKSSAYILKNLPRDKFEVIDLFLDKAGSWHMAGLPLSHDKLRLRVDVVWNAVHGFYGEDGKLEHMLESLGMRHTGPGPLTSAITMNKKLTKGQLAQHGIKTARGIYIEEWGEGNQEEIIGEVVRQVSRKFSPPWNVEPISQSQSNGPATVNTREDLAMMLTQLCDLKIPTLIEEAVLGTKACVVCSSGFRNEPTYVFLPSEAGKAGKRMHKEEAKKIQEIAKKIHEKMLLGSYSCVHVIVDKRGEVFVTDVETMPAFHEGSHLHHALDGVGSSFKEFAEHFIGAGMRKK